MLTAKILFNNNNMVVDCIKKIKLVELTSKPLERINEIKNYNIIWNSQI